MTDDMNWTQADVAVLLCGGNPRTVHERAYDRAMSPELILHACKQTLNAQNEFTDRCAPFSRWDAIAPGCLDVRVFDQARYWVDAVRIPHLISDRDDMTDNYLSSLIDFLIDHAEYMLRGYLRYRPIPISKPCQWMESTNLMRALRAETRTRAE